MVKNYGAVFSTGRRLKNLRMNLKIMLMVLTMAFGISASAYGEDAPAFADAAQQITVRGVVTERATNEPLPGTTIMVRGTTTGTVTDVDGRYTLQVPAANAVLQFSYVGFVTREIALAGQTELNVMLESDVALLSEVVVVGYGTTRRADLTGAVSSVSQERLVDRPAISLGESIMGKISGVHVQRAGGGEPGGRPQIRIRGISSVNTGLDPLFVVDGIVGVRDPLQNLNPNDIKSIDVLKDASATAIYGARGANGVIIIETKRGEAGVTQVSYRGVGTFSTRWRELPMLNAEQIMYVYEQAMANVTKYGTRNPGKDFRGPYSTGTTYSEMPHIFKQVPAGSYPVDLIGKDGNYYAPRFDNNWEEIIYQDSFSNSHYLDIRGGSESAVYSLSAGMDDQQGIMQDSWMKRYTSRMTGDIDVTNWIKISTQLGYTKTERTHDDGVARNAAEVWSIVPVKYPDDPETYGMYAGRWGTNADFNIGEQWFNPMFVRDQNSRRFHRDQVLASAIMRFQLTDNLIFSSDFSVMPASAKTTGMTGYSIAGTPTARIDAGNQRYWQSENYLNYTNTFGDSHNLTAMAGLSWSERRWENMWAQNREYFTNFYGWSSLQSGGAARPGVNSSDGRSALNSYFGRLNYDYQGKYLLTLTGRMDGSTKFGKDNKYAFFPSAGVAWRISQEDFWTVDAVSNLKLRGSYGQTGNQEINSYSTQRYVGAASNILLGGRANVGIFPNSMGNNQLKWETITQWDIGLDVGLFRTAST
jgi:TonB-dependent starch-binding outer membrane protein SusC